MKFASKEEEQFNYWIEEADKYGLVFDVEYQPEPFLLSGKVEYVIGKQLKTKKKKGFKHLLHPHQYTPDWRFAIKNKALGDVFILPFDSIEQPVFIDIKGGFQQYDGSRSFSINQKWVWDKHTVFIQKITPGKLFKETWCPEGCRYTPVKKQPVKKFQSLKTVEEYLWNLI